MRESRTKERNQIRHETDPTVRAENKEQRVLRRSAGSDRYSSAVEASSRYSDGDMPYSARKAR